MTTRPDRFNPKRRLDLDHSGLDGVVFAVALVGTLIAGLWSLKSIPFYEPWWGLDFQNMYIYHICSPARDLGIYVATGAECGDVTGRGFIYPPLMFHMFDWVSPFTFRQATAIWIGAIGVLIGLSGSIWAWFDGQFRKSWRFAVLAVSWALLLAQYPIVFAMERGNNDTIPVVFWTIGAVLFVSSRYRLAGFAVGLAVAAKLYPAIALAVVAAGLLRMGRKVALQFIVGGIVAAMVALLIAPDDTIHYVTVLMPTVSDHLNPLFAYSHTLRSLPVAAPLQWLLGATLFGSWAVASWRRLSDEPLIIFAGALAISTYYSGISWDYNLITTYPLLLLVMARALSHGSGALWKFAALGSVLSIAAGRGMFSASGQLILQIISLIGIAWLVVTSEALRTHGATPAEAAAQRQTIRG